MSTRGIISFSAICIFLLVGGASASSEEHEEQELVEFKAPEFNEIYLPKYHVQEYEYLPEDYYLQNEIDIHQKPKDGSSSEEESDEEDHYEDEDDYLHEFVPKYKREIFDEVPKINVPQGIQVSPQGIQVSPPGIQALPQGIQVLPQLVPQFKVGLPNLIQNEEQPKIREARCNNKKPILQKKSSFGKKKK